MGGAAQPLYPMERRIIVSALHSVSATVHELSLDALT